MGGATSAPAHNGGGAAKASSPKAKGLQRAASYDTPSTPKAALHRQASYDTSAAPQEGAPPSAPPAPNECPKRRGCNGAGWGPPLLPPVVDTSGPPSQRPLPGDDVTLPGASHAAGAGGGLVGGRASTADHTHASSYLINHQRTTT